MFISDKSFDDEIQSPSSDESGQEDEPSETDPVNNEDDESAPDSAFAELAKKKGFKSADELAKAYAELEAQNKKVEMDRAELLKARNVTPEPKKDESLDKAALRRIEERQKLIDEKMEIQDVFQKHPDAQKYINEMKEYATAHPTIPWETVYRQVSYDDRVKEAKEQGREEAYKNIKKKESGTERASIKIEDKEDVAKMLHDKKVSLTDIEKMLPHR